MRLPLIVFVLAPILSTAHLPGAQFLTPVDVAPCDLATHPKSLDGKSVRVRAELSVHFEDFSLRIPNCRASQGVWLAFGGDVAGIVPSSVNDSPRRPGSNIKVRGVSYGLKKDDNF